MNCRKCGEKAVMKIRRANTAFCKEHYSEFVERQTENAIEEFDMLQHGDKILICISGGKDSLVLWYLLNKMGYDTHGLYISLGIEGYSDRSKIKIQTFAKKHNLGYTIIDLSEKGHPVQPVAKKVKRPVCAICGQIKRYYFNKTAYDMGFDVVATGHNLDDEASRLMGNLLGWNTYYIARQSPVMAAEGRCFKRKIKPLIRLTEQEVAAFAFINGIDYIMEECPESRGATSIAHKNALNLVDAESPGIKHNFMINFLREHKEFFKSAAPERDETKGICKVCGMDSAVDLCGFCDLMTKFRQGA